ncbi:MAG: restriction endonuclease subunit S [Erysipelotrichaceae bacterium]|nr:restriction endonuclease subunit S [Erysipelotrichaceae bacterium]
MKQTEIGMIPDDWEVKEIKEFADVTTGNKNTQDAQGNGKYPFYVRSPIVERINTFSFDSEGLVTAGDGVGTGKVFHFVKGKFGLHQRAYLVHKFQNVDSKYFYYIFSQNFYERVHSMTAKSSVDSVRREMITQMSIPLPPTLAEQQKIAKALSDVDNVISTLEKLITKKKNLKQGTMQQLLTGKKRLPGFAPAVVALRQAQEPQLETPATKQTELGEIPADWEIVNINKTCTIKARIGWQGLKSDEYLDTGDYLLITGTDFDNGFINWKNCNYVTEWRFKQDKNIQIKKGDVLITKDGTIGKVAFLNEVPMDGTLNSGIFVVRPKDSNIIDSVFLSLIFKSFWFDNFLEQITSGSTIVHLYQKDFVKFNFILPSKSEQIAIANVLSSMDKEIEALEAKLGKYRNLKTGMMQQLLTGKIRLK